MEKKRRDRPSEQIQKPYLLRNNALHTTSAQLSSVSTTTNALVGREQEINALGSLLQQPTTRLVTLWGPGGVGKTQLARAVATECSALFTDGGDFVSLASVATVELVIASIAHTLGIKERREVLSLEMVKATLHDKELLLILDNFEHVLSAAPLLTELLQACPGLKLLVTSRAVLRIQMEHRFPVAPLLLPDIGHMEDCQALSLVPAVALFVQRTQHIRADFRLTPTNARAVAEICVLLDGLPLALELAAARMNLFTPQGLLTRLKESLTMLGQGLRDAPTRQRTLFETMQWSYNLLTTEEQQMFQRLCVFSDGCTLEAAEAIGRDGTGYEPCTIFNLVASLVDQSLLHVQRSGEDEEQRLMLLETIRTYGLECLKQSGQEEKVREAHAKYYLVYAQNVAPKLLSAEQKFWFKLLENERENFRAALGWFIASHNATSALLLSATLWTFWVRLHAAEGHHWIEMALDQARTTTVDVQIQANAHYVAALMAFFKGNGQNSSLHLDQAVQLYQCSGDKDGLAMARNSQAFLALEQHDYVTLETLVKETLSLKPALSVPWIIIHTLYIISVRDYFQGDYERASTVGEEMLSLCRRIGEPHMLSQALAVQGLFAYARGEEKTACIWYNECLQVIGASENADDRPSKTASLLGLAGIAAEQGRYQRAAQLWGAVEALYKRVEGTIGDAMIQQWLDTTARRQSNYEHMVARARAHLGEQVFSAEWNKGKTMSIDQLLACHEEIAPSPATLPQERQPTNKPVAVCPLTPREVEVLHLVAQGFTSTQIAEQLVITTLTVNSHIRSIYSKLGISTRAAATRYALEQQGQCETGQ